MIKTPIIMKQNPLIFAEFEKAFSEVDHDVVNILLHALQNELLFSDGSKMDLVNYEKIPNRTVKIRAGKFKVLGKFGKNGNQEIFHSLKKINDTSAVIRNFTDIDGVRVKASTVNIIDKVSWIEKDGTEDSREHIFEIQFNEWFLRVSTKSFNQQVGNFTPLLLSDVSGLKSSFAKTLYEILESKKYRETTFALKLEDMRKIFNLPERNLSYFVDAIKRNKKNIDILIHFEYEVFKKDKLISFQYI